LLDQTQKLIISVLWAEVALEFPSNVAKGSVIILKGARLIHNHYYGRSISASNGTLVKINEMEIKNCQMIKEWFSKKNFKINHESLWNNKLLIFEDEDHVDVDHMLLHMYCNTEKYNKNVVANIMKFNETKQNVCPYKSCKNKKVEINEKKKFICGKCGNKIRPKEILTVHAFLGNNPERCIEVYCYEDLAERLAKEYSNGIRKFIFRISGFLRLKDVIFSILYINLKNVIEINYF